ncbi:MAG: cation:proton antiporter, partial [Phycisphaerales bacterium]
MDLWTGLLDVLILLLAALVLGALCERLKQSAILGYLLAGTLLGPNALDWMPNHRAVSAIAELGVSLLLFTIGLEFSWRRLRALGPIALGGGTLQVLVTGALVAGLCMRLGLGGRAAVAIGAIIALSSTACVLRVLVSRAEIDGVYGRKALGILLLQDIAVVPLVLVVTVLGREGSAAQFGWEAGRAVGAAAILGGALYMLLKYLVPVLLNREEAARNRELPILLAMVMAVGAAWTAHRLGLSPALGAFFAGMLLAESPFATAIRGDIAPLRTLFVTLFFSSIGMLADPAWAVEHWALLAAAVAAIVFGKAAITCAVAWLFRSTFGHAVAVGVCLAQVGEFSFVIAGVARQGELIDEDLFKLVVSATVATLFLTPYLVA